MREAEDLSPHRFLYYQRFHSVILYHAAAVAQQNAGRVLHAHAALFLHALDGHVLHDHDAHAPPAHGGQRTRKLLADDAACIEGAEEMEHRREHLVLLEEPLDHRKVALLDESEMRDKLDILKIN